jgi:hypothetical protein
MAFTNDERFNILMASMEYRYANSKLWKTPEPTNDAQRIARLLEVVDLLETDLGVLNRGFKDATKKLRWAEALLKPKAKRGKK